MTSQKRKSLAVDDKVNALLCVENGEKKTDVAQRLGIPLSTLSTWIKNKEKIMATSDCNNPDRKRQRASNFADVEEALLDWFKQARTNLIPVSGPILLAQAQKFADAFGHQDFKCSNGWLDRFKNRNGIAFKCIAGESGSVTDEMKSEWQKTSLPTILKQYAPRDIYNMDETGLFFRMTPDKTMAFKDDACHGGKKSKERITAAVCANMDGSDKMKLLVIGKFQNPRCFKNVKSLPVDYYYNRKAWMLSGIFEDWLRKLDKKFARNGRKIIMLVDNCPAHPKVSNLKSINLCFLPPNTTSCLQPMDQGIIQNLKVFYRRQVVERILQSIDDGKPADSKVINVLDAIRMLHNAWHQVTAETIANCFKHAGFVPYTASHDESEVPAVEAAGTTSSDPDNIWDRLQVATFHQAEPTPMATTSKAPAATSKINPRNIWERLRTALTIPNEVKLSDFLKVDDQLATTNTKTDDEIVESVKQRQGIDSEVEPVVGDEDDDVDDTTEPAVSYSSLDALNALAVVRQWLESQESTEANSFSHVAELDRIINSVRSSKQASITDFFNKQ